MTSPPTSRSRRRLLRFWAVISAVYVLVAGVASAGPLQAAIGRAHTVQASAVAQAPHPAVPGGPIPEAPDGPAEMVAKAVGVEILLLLGPPLLLLWFGWDVWFALAGFFPALTGSPEQGRE